MMYLIMRIIRNLGNNHIILCTDGDFNIEVSSNKDIETRLLNNEDFNDKV